MPKNNWITRLIGKRAQEIPGWAYIIAIIIGLMVLVVLLWIAAKSGKVGLEQLTEIR